MHEALIQNLRRHIEPTEEETEIFLSLAVAKTIKSFY
jgi:hypothetical protein